MTKTTQEERDAIRYNEARHLLANRVLERLCDDADCLDVIERQVRELASRLDHCDDSVSVQEVRPIGRELRAIIDSSSEHS